MNQRSFYSFHVTQTMNQQFEHQHPLDILQWVYHNIEDVEIGTSLGPSGIAIIHLAKQIVKKPKIFLLDTDFLFPQTLLLKTQIEQTLNVDIQVVNSELSPQEQAQHYAPELWKTDPDRCCTLRKVNPLQNHLQHMQGWINGVRRTQGGARRTTPILSPITTLHGHSLLKISPLANWNRKQVWNYLHTHQLPYNSLHDQGYSSIGCTHCTQTVKQIDHDQQERDGRWVHSTKSECGIHTFHQHT